MSVNDEALDRKKRTMYIKKQWHTTLRITFFVGKKHLFQTALKNLPNKHFDFGELLLYSTHSHVDLFSHKSGETKKKKKKKKKKNKQTNKKKKNKQKKKTKKNPKKTQYSATFQETQLTDYTAQAITVYVSAQSDQLPSYNCSLSINRFDANRF